MSRLIVWADWVRAACLGLVLISDPASAGRDVAVHHEASQLLREALERRYGCDLQARLRLVSHGRSGGSRVRLVESVTKNVRGRTHALARVLLPQHLRGMTILAVEGVGRPDDVFVYLPALARTRRVVEARRGEAFLGTDFTWADLEGHRRRDYVVMGVRATAVDGERAHRVETRPRDGGPVFRVDFIAAEADLAILRIDSWGAAGLLRRSVRIERSAIWAFGRFRIPTRLEAFDHRRGTRTELRVQSLVFEPDVPDELFTEVTLDSGRPIAPR